jgi:hypothetical protein
MEENANRYEMHTTCEKKECPYIDARSMATECSINIVCPEQDALNDLVDLYKKTGKPVSEKHIEERIAEIFGGPEWVEKKQAEIQDIKSRITEILIKNKMM